VTNDDDHLRNHGFIWDPTLRGWKPWPVPICASSFPDSSNLQGGVRARVRQG
jgi:hypothetical protein